MKKLLGEERRTELVNILKHSKKPVTGTDLAHRANVSRQVIVNDMNILKARNIPIIATSQGYIYMTNEHTNQQFERKIACLHTAEQAKDELLTIVDCGVMVKNVIVEHPIYGELTASLMLSNRMDVLHFIKQVNETKASFLSALTNGTHLHLLSAPTMKQLDQAEQFLKEKGYILEE